MSSHKFSEEELERIFDEIFARFKRHRIFFNEFEEYLEAKGYSKDDIEEIWFQGLMFNIIDSGVFPVEGKPVMTISRATKEDEDEMVI